MGSKRARQASVARPETNNLPAAPLLVCGFYVLVRSDRRNMRDTGEDSSELTRALLYGRGQDRTIEPPIIGAATVELSKAKHCFPFPNAAVA